MDELEESPTSLCTIAKRTQPYIKAGDLLRALAQFASSFRTERFSPELHSHYLFLKRENPKIFYKFAIISSVSPKVRKMKAQVNSVPVEYLRRGVDSSSGVGKVHKKAAKKEEKESQEIKAYLNKLQELVPFTPKNKKLSKLEVISYVIDYIQDLRETLGLPPSPCQNGSDSLDEQFTWMLTSSSSSAVHDDDFCDNEEDSSSVPVAPSPTTLAAATITVTTSNVTTSSSEHFQSSRQPLCVIPNPRGNSHPAQNHLTASPNSVKSPVVLGSVSSNCGH